METSHHTAASFSLPALSRPNFLRRFFIWCESQNNNRMAWLAISLASHGCLFTPVTVFFIMMSGNNFVLFPFALAAMAMCLVVNLAALPTKITIPVFAASLAIDLFVIVNCIIAGLHGF